MVAHASLFFTDDATRILDQSAIHLVPYSEAKTANEPGIYIPIDVPSSLTPEILWRVPFNGTELTLWNRLDRPGSDWDIFPDESRPLWYRNGNGALIPVWNLFANLYDLLSFREDREIDQRDRHGRFIASYSPRHAMRLLEVPVFNEAVATIVAACVGLRGDGTPAMHLDGHLKAPVVVLSHDCDILEGNDLWTQAVRAWRIVAPLFRARPPKLGNLWWMTRNAVTPRRFYFDNVGGMVDLERSYGYASTFYMLNGSGGRFGSRSGLAIIPEVAAVASSPWDVGIHYNYDTFLDDSRFADQLAELKNVLTRPIHTGRAHYLRFDGQKSLPMLDSFGIQCDESAGYPDFIGYRCGIAGCFQPWDSSSGGLLNIRAVPMTIMDATLIRQYGDDSVSTFSRMLRHLAGVGGALSFIVHPGMFFNPEVPQMLGVYHRLLVEARQIGAKSATALELARGHAARLARPS